ncbi:MAG TPA: FAD-dependent oxidoreductase [Gemmatimonadaceae bacterium]|nr:FAD-dependent oxidoreductase [Gemmatimonadaceae bacterium]
MALSSAHVSTLAEGRLVRREQVAADTIACWLSRPADFTFAPGQYVEVTLLSPAFEDAQGPTRAMSIASGPADDELLLLMRVRDTAFKRSIATMRLGSPVLLDGPADDLRIDPSSAEHAVFVAGGVGVAPFRSLLRQAAIAGSLDATLFYSNRRPEDAAFLDELCAMPSRVRGLRVVPTMTGMADSRQPWSGQTERLGPTLFARYVPDYRAARFYVSGSTVLVSGVCFALERAGIPMGRIAVELYSGY